MTLVPTLGAVRTLSTLQPDQLGISVKHVDTITLLPDEGILVINGWFRMPTTGGAILGWH